MKWPLCIIRPFIIYDNHIVIWLIFTLTSKPNMAADIRCFLYKISLVCIYNKNIKPSKHQHQYDILFYLNPLCMIVFISSYLIFEVKYS